MDKSTVIKTLRAIIWLGLAVIFFSSSLYVAQKMFFPFIVGKSLVFRVTVELMIFVFMTLSLVSSKYKIRINFITIILFTYLVFSFISSFLGDNFYLSFWSNNERSEGLLLLVHLFLFFVILTSFLRQIKDWLLAFDIFFFSSVLVLLYSLAQYLHLSIVMPSSDGTRLAGTLGNSGYMAGYLVFAVFIGCFLLFYRKNKSLLFYYLPAIFLQVFIVFNTQTRGGILALFFGGIVFISYLFFYYFKDLAVSDFINGRVFRYIGLIIISISILFSFLIFTNKDSVFIKNNTILSRISSISFTETTASNRLLTWETSIKGFKERPILGWGQENFYQVFDKHFNPKIYRKANSITWFDRAHNIIFDRLITGGIVGLSLYLFFLFLPLYFLWRNFLGRENKNKYFIPFVFTVIIVTYFIQNLFIFEALVTYVPLFTVLAFASLFAKDYRLSFLENNNIKKILFIITFVSIVPSLYFFNIKPVKANLDLVTVLSSPNLTIEQAMQKFDNVFNQRTMGNQEYRKQYYNYFTNVLSQFVEAKYFNNPNAVSVLSNLADDVEQKLLDQIEENPYSAANYLMLMSFNGNASFFNIDRLKNNINIFDQAIYLSPDRPQLYSEIGATYLKIGDIYKSQEESELSNQYYQNAIDNFKKVVDLNDTNIDSWVSLALAFKVSGRKEEALNIAKRVIEIKPSRQDWYDEFIGSL